MSFLNRLQIARLAKVVRNADIELSFVSETPEEDTEVTPVYTERANPKNKAANGALHVQKLRDCIESVAVAIMQQTMLRDVEYDRLVESAAQNFYPQPEDKLQRDVFLGTMHEAYEIIEARNSDLHLN